MEPECDDHSDPELDRNCESLGEVDFVAAVVERKNRVTPTTCASEKVEKNSIHSSICQTS